VLKTLPDSDLERSHLAVLFAGVKGFRKYADSKEPGQVIRDMNGYLAVATENITKFGGEVDKFVGDAVVAVFRSSVHQPDHIERAVRSAAAIQKALQQEGRDGNPLYATIGIGISSGVALSGRLTVGEYSEPLYIGEGFKAAYMLHVMADPGEIVISRDIYQVMEKSLSVEPLPPREMMERTEPWENFRLLRVLDEQEIRV
jgi:class 3 adenylate cyclase